MITIDQLLESVDLDFEPRWVTKDKNGLIRIFEHKPEKGSGYWLAEHPFCGNTFISFIKLAEFDGKDWTECIYEVPRKTTGKIEKLETTEKQRFVMLNKINELVDAVNELKGANQ